MNTPQTPEDKYGIMLPCAPNDFGRFISSLLGKPQTLEKSIRGVFCIGRDEIVSTFTILMSRAKSARAIKADRDGRPCGAAAHPPH